MTNPKDNENEELSTDELKGVSGGFPGPVSQKGPHGEDRLNPRGLGGGNVLTLPPDTEGGEPITT
ncbi:MULTISPECIES: hypothetical protein [unclassified Prochlorococcus]|uniref:hypothetical protein n=1 Tax=unclassified Prochlorococcus TaxID=2627481 RepID=UPI000B18FA14|nr:MULTISPECIES: hypothetical protein [unclassified Prochlorococcus]